MRDDVIKELNTFLQGNYMAVHAYEKYIQHVNDEKIKQLLQEIQQNHKQHATLIAERIQNLGGVPADDVGFIGRVAEWVQSLKGTTTDPTHILKDALVGEHRGIEKSKQMLHNDLDEESLKLVERILNADEQHIEQINALLH